VAAIEFTGEANYRWDGSGFRPIVPIRLTNPTSGASLDAYGLVDSGADYSIVRVETLRRLGLDLRASGQRQLVSAAGALIVNEFRVLVEVCGAQFQAIVLASVIENLSFEILGRDPLFRHVHFAFEEYAEAWRNRILWKLP
jgi:hypothetical protein